jgi:hypothetical protein
MTTLHNYLARLQSTINSRQEIKVELMEISDNSEEADELSKFNAKLRFYDESQLEAFEALLEEYRRVVKSRYSYHYQNSEGKLIFRYDNAPHYPEIETHPHHKHVGSDENVIAAQPPDLSDVLNEIDGIIYPKA